MEPSCSIGSSELALFHTPQGTQLGEPLEGLVRLGEEFSTADFCSLPDDVIVHVIIPMLEPEQLLEFALISRTQAAAVALYVSNIRPEAEELAQRHPFIKKAWDTAKSTPIPNFSAFFRKVSPGCRNIYSHYETLMNEPTTDFVKQIRHTMLNRIHPAISCLSYDPKWRAYIFEREPAWLWEDPAHVLFVAHHAGLHKDFLLKLANASPSHWYLAELRNEVMSLADDIPEIMPARAPLEYNNQPDYKHFVQALISPGKSPNFSRYKAIGKAPSSKLVRELRHQMATHIVDKACQKLQEREPDYDYRRHMEMPGEIPDWCWGEKGFISAAIRWHTNALQFASYEIRNNKQIVTEACKINCGALNFASDELKDDVDFMLSLAQLNIDSLAYASERVLQDERLLLNSIHWDIKDVNRLIQRHKGQPKFAALLAVLEQQAQHTAQE